MLKSLRQLGWIIAVLCLVLLTFIATEAIRNRHTDEKLGYIYPTDSGRVWIWDFMSTADGRTQIAVGRIYSIPEIRIDDARSSFGVQAGRWRYFRGDAHNATLVFDGPPPFAKFVQLGRFNVGRRLLPGMVPNAPHLVMDDEWVAVPTWVAFSTLAATPAVPIVLLRRFRRVPGLCHRCGYDLRATPGRCPECGSEVQTSRS